MELVTGCSILLKRLECISIAMVLLLKQVHHHSCDVTHLTLWYFWWGQRTKAVLQINLDSQGYCSSSSKNLKGSKTFGLQDLSIELSLWTMEIDFFNKLLLLVTLHSCKILCKYLTNEKFSKELVTFNNTVWEKTLFNNEMVCLNK